MRMPLDEHVCLHYCQVAGFDLTLIARFRAAAWQIFRVTNFVYSEIRKKRHYFRVTNSISPLSHLVWDEFLNDASGLRFVFLPNRRFRR